MRSFTGFSKGVNLGGWLSQYDETSKEYYDTFITEEDIRQIAGMGFDHVRVPVDYPVLEKEDGTPLEDGYAYLDKCAAWCRTLGLHMLIDLHKTYGYSFDPLDRKMDREAFFRNSALQERFYALWRKLAARYAHDTDMVAFELLNEIVSPHVAEEWNCIADRAVEEIRRLAGDAWVVIGGVRYNNVTSVPMLHKPLDEHIVYNFHCYEPLIFTHQKAYWVDNMPSDLTVEYPGSLEIIRRTSELLPEELAAAVYDEGIVSIGPEFFEHLFLPAIEAAEENGAPLYCGEYGVIDRAPQQSALRWHQDIHAVFEKYRIGRALWTWKKKDFGLTDSHYDEIREELVKCL